MLETKKMHLAYLWIQVSFQWHQFKNFVYLIFSSKANTNKLLKKTNTLQEEFNLFNGSLNGMRNLFERNKDIRNLLRILKMEKRLNFYLQST